MNHNTTCGGLIKQFNDALSRRANNSLRKDDLTMTQLGVLLILNETPEGRMNMNELEHALHVAQPTAVVIVKRLEHKGFIESCCNPEDKRIKIVTITEKKQWIFSVPCLLAGLSQKMQFPPWPPCSCFSSTILLIPFPLARLTKHFK